MSTKAEWDELQKQGIGGMVGMILQHSAEENTHLLQIGYDHAQERIAKLEKENRMLQNRIRNAQNKFASFFWDSSEEDWGA